MAISNVLYSSESEVWETPKDLFDKLDTEFHFDIDVCVPYLPMLNALLSLLQNRMAWSRSGKVSAG